MRRPVARLVWGGLKNASPLRSRRWLKALAARSCAHGADDDGGILGGIGPSRLWIRSSEMLRPHDAATSLRCQATKRARLGKASRDSLRRPMIQRDREIARRRRRPARRPRRSDADDVVAASWALGLIRNGGHDAAFPRLGLGERVRPFRIAIASISRRAARDRCDGDAEGARGPVLVESTGAPACNRAGVDNRPLTRSRLTGSGNGSGVRSVCRADLPVVMRFTCGTDFAYFAVVRRCAAA